MRFIFWFSRGLLIKARQLSYRLSYSIVWKLQKFTRIKKRIFIKNIFSCSLAMWKQKNCCYSKYRVLRCGSQARFRKLYSILFCKKWRNNWQFWKNDAWRFSKLKKTSSFHWTLLTFLPILFIQIKCFKSWQYFSDKRIKLVKICFCNKFHFSDSLCWYEILKIT